jgi:hypothetical protein
MYSYIVAVWFVRSWLCYDCMNDGSVLSRYLDYKPTYSILFTYILIALQMEHNNGMEFLCILAYQRLSA